MLFLTNTYTQCYGDELCLAAETLEVHFACLKMIFLVHIVTVLGCGVLGAFSPLSNTSVSP